MVQSYTRFELSKTMGVIASHSNSVYIPPSDIKSGGKVITSGLEEILVWNIKTGELLQTMRDGPMPGSLSSATQSAPSEINSLAYEQLSNIVAAGYSDGSIKIWDMTSGSVLINFEGHRSAVTMLKFDRSGTRLVSGSRDTSIIVWDLVGETGLFKLKGHKDEITGMEFLSSTEKADVDEMDDWLLTTSKDGMIKLWDLKAKQCVETHLAHNRECWSLGLNHSKEVCVTCGMDDEVKVWAVDLSQPETKIVEQGSFKKESKHRGMKVEFHNTTQGEFFYICNTDKICEIFRFRTEKEIKKAAAKRTKRLHEKGMNDEQITADLAKSQIHFLVAPFTTIYADRGKLRSATWGRTSDRRLDILLTQTNNTVTYYKIKIPESARKIKSTDEVAEVKYRLNQLGHRHDMRAVDVSDDDSMIITGSNGQLKVWNAKRGTLVRSFDKVGYIISAKFLPGGGLVVIGTKDGQLQLLDLATSTILDSVEDAHQGKTIWSIDLTPDGKTIVTASADKTVKFWEIKVTKDLVPGTTDKYIELLKLDHTKTLELTEDASSVKVSPDSKYLAVGLMDNTVKIFFYDTLKFYLSLYGHKLPVLSIDISFDSKIIITSSADKNIRIWGLDFGDCHRSIFGHQDAIMAVRFFPESKNFVSCSKDGMVKTWDGIKFENIQKLAVHQSEVWSLAISHSGDFFVSVSHDSSIRIWEKTEDQVFLEEEREREMDENYEDELISSLDKGEGDDIKPTDEDEDENSDAVTNVTKQSMEKLKAGEKLMEALDLCWEQVHLEEEYQRKLQLFQHGKNGMIKPTKPDTNALLKALNKPPSEYVLDTLVKIKPSQLEDALLVLPFSYTTKLLDFVRIWTRPENRGKSGIRMPRICKTLFFVMQANSMELISQKDPMLKKGILELKDQLRSILKETRDDLGYNIAGLKYIQKQWNESHSHIYQDNDEEDKGKLKRAYTTIA